MIEPVESPPGAVSETSREAPLEVKEGIVLDAEGRPLHSPFRAQGAAGRVRAFRVSGLLAPVVAIGVLCLVVAGFTVIAAIMGLLIVIWILRGFARAVIGR